MKEFRPGDLVRDGFDNVGVVLEIVHFGNGPAAHVQFTPGSGYDGDQGWIVVSLLEVINESS